MKASLSFVFLGVCATVYLVGSLLINFERPLATVRRGAGSTPESVEVGAVR